MIDYYFGEEIVWQIGWGYCLLYKESMLGIISSPLKLMCNLTLFREQKHIKPCRYSQLNAVIIFQMLSTALILQL